MGYGRRRFDFSSGGVPSELTQIVADDGSVTVSDDELRLEVVTGTTGSDAAGVALAVDRTVGNYQRWIVCVKGLTITTTPRLAGPVLEYIPSAVSTPPVDLTAWLARWLMGHYTFRTGTTNYSQCQYYTTGAVATRWDDTGLAWGTGNLQSVLRAQQADDYEIRILELDDVLDRVRCLVIGGTVGTSLSADRNGPYLACVTDWVDLSAIRDGSQTADLYITVGYLAASVAWASGTGQVVEWIEHEWSDELFFNSANYKAFDQGSGYDARALSGLRLDTAWWLPVSRTATMVAPVGATWESDKAGQWRGVLWSTLLGKYVMVYSGHDGTNPRVGVATATDPFSTWTKYGSNPILPVDSGQAYEGKIEPVPVEDWTEPDPAKRCKIIQTVSGSDGLIRVYLYTASTWETTSWTREGELLAQDASDGDAGVQVYNGAWYYDGRTWHIYYVGMNTSAAWHVYRAHGPKLAVGSFTKDRSVDYITSADGLEMSVTTASSTSRQVTVGSTTGAVRDQPVVYDSDATSSNYRLNRIRKIVSSTVLELYHFGPGMTNAGVLRTLPKGKAYPTNVMPFGDEWLMHGTTFALMYLHASFGANHEGAALWRTPSLLVKPTYDNFASPGVRVTRETNTTGSAENPALLRRPVVSHIPYRQRRSRRDAIHVR